MGNKIKKNDQFTKNKDKVEKGDNYLDVRDPSSFNFNDKIKTVVLLAAEHSDDVSPISLYYDVNVRGTENVLREMDKYNELIESRHFNKLG